MSRRQVGIPGSMSGERGWVSQVPWQGQGRGWISKGPCLEGCPRSGVQEEGGAVYATMWPIRSEDVPNLPQTSFVAGRNNFFELICFHLFVAGGVGKSALTIQLIQNQ